jgi:hypothetical protein
MGLVIYVIPVTLREIKSDITPENRVTIDMDHAFKWGFPMDKHLGQIPEAPRSQLR